MSTPETLNSIFTNPGDSAIATDELFPETEAPSDKEIRDSDKQATFFYFIAGVIVMIMLSK